MGLLAGASGFSFASWRPGFYPAGTKPAEFLAFYAQRLSTVELNTTFYRLPPAAQLQRWSEAVPDGFRFAVKAPMSVSVWGHTGEIPELCSRIRALGDRLGPVLVRLHDAKRRDEAFATALLEPMDDDLQVVLDARDPSWDGIEELLAGFGAVRVNQLDTEAGFRYLRFRDPPYADAELRRWAARLRDVDAPVFAYFRHEDEPTAPAYALRLTELVADADH